MSIYSRVLSSISKTNVSFQETEGCLIDHFSCVINNFDIHVFETFEAKTCKELAILQVIDIVTGVCLISIDIINYDEEATDKIIARVVAFATA